MRKGTRLIVAVGILTACVQFKTVQLPEDLPLDQYAEIGIVSSISAGESKGLLANGKMNIGNWVSNAPSRMKMYGVGDTLVLNAVNVGPHWEELVLELPPTDFSKHQHITFTCKIDGIKIPVMRVDLLDENGRITNSRPQALKLAPRSGFQRYDFNFNGAFYQNWPYKEEVNANRITQIRINVNGGGSAYTGKIYITSIRAVNEF